MSTPVKSFPFAILVLVFLSFGSLAKAEEVTIRGFTNGCFGVGCTPGTTSGDPPITLLGLTFNSSSFFGNTDHGFVNINLGSFSLSSAPADYTGQAFTLRVTFTAPSGIVGGNDVTLSAPLTGTVTSTGGRVTIGFSSTPRTFVFSFGDQNTTVNGSFNMSLTSVSLGTGETIAVPGTITDAQQIVRTIPEPTTAVLLGTGLASIATGLYKRRKRKQR